MESLPDRPQPARPIADTVRAWLQWFGLARLVVIGCAVGAVGAGAFWLLRAPPTPVENTLPMASRSATTVAQVIASTSPNSPSAESVPAGTSVAPGGDTVTVVDVAGAVLAPGVYELVGTPRVHQAIAAAGGLAPDADVEAINLAGIIRDGDRLYVPHVGRPVPSVVVPVGGVSSRPGSPTQPSTPAEPVDLNRATVDELDALPGVGPATAAAIVAYRENRGPFSSVDDLLKVRGIGPAKLEAIRSLVTV